MKEIRTFNCREGRASIAFGLSDENEVYLTFAFCNDKDQYSKSRGIGIVEGRMNLPLGPVRKHSHRYGVGTYNGDDFFGDIVRPLSRFFCSELVGYTLPPEYRAEYARQHTATKANKILEDLNTVYKEMTEAAHG